ncbi:hypothetical protein DPQ33_02265 [Oceanidesulfovibrio indonesiensis]|uniref:Uncharacterized protein n=1 Tax=Oceanidesulfovibrio indonesiensis TaxID=54767 RepID=A0A7M3MIJ5_9BACT|nr:SDR family NAD(P)-dependent oxidoreductase [Oceanidesulfovibrio indonesiensis]TVM19205.1 hypothetical protein DPQ33_02265 [Oceanidesulfovibrio indonesiensis]
MQNKRILVTGGLGGIGRAIVEVAHEQGAQVAIWDIAEPPSELRDVTIRVDASEEASVEAAFDDMAMQGALPHALINAVGVFTALLPFEALSAEDFQKVMNTNALSYFLTCRGLLRRTKDAAIVNVSSALGKRPIPLSTAYSASKAAIDSITRSIALEYAAHGVRANAVTPGPVGGALLDNALAEASSVVGCQPDDVQAQMLSLLPQGKLVTARDVAELSVFLASDKAGAITGQAFNVCCGYYM